MLGDSDELSETEVEVRVIYDGALGAGRATNVEVLLDALARSGRGRVIRGRRDDPPGSFVWREFADVQIAGLPVSCQVVATSGYRGTEHLDLVESAHAIVFVVDSRPVAIERACIAFEKLRKHLARIGRQTPIVMQANKRDILDALPSRAVGRQLQFSGRVFDARAKLGAGVRDTFLAALRGAVRSLRHLVEPCVVGASEGRPQLGASVEGVAAGNESARAGGVIASECVSQAGMDDPLDSQSSHEVAGAAPAPNLPADQEGSASEVSEVGIDRGAVSSHGCVSVVRAATVSGERIELGDVPGGGIWPACEMRGILQQIRDQGLEAQVQCRPWVSDKCKEVVSDPWILHSGPQSARLDLGEARAALVVSVQHCLDMAGWLPRHRGFFIAGDGDSWHLWMVSRDDERCLRREFEDALLAMNPQALEEAMLHWLRFERALRRMPPMLGLHLRLSTVSVSKNGVSCLAPPLPAHASGPADVGSELVELFRMRGRESVALGARAAHNAARCCGNGELAERMAKKLESGSVSA